MIDENYIDENFSWGGKLIEEEAKGICQIEFQIFWNEFFKNIAKLNSWKKVYGNNYATHWKYIEGYAVKILRIRGYKAHKYYLDFKKEKNDK